MDDQPLQLDHKKFIFEIINGAVIKTNAYDGNITPTPEPATQTTTPSKKLEFWLETPDDKQYHFIINPARIPIEKGQTLRLLATSGLNAGAVLIYDTKEKELYTNMTIIRLVFNEAPLLNVMLMVAAIIGIFFAAGPPLISALYTGLILFNAMRWTSRLMFYHKKLNMIKSKFFEQDT